VTEPGVQTGRVVHGEVDGGEVDRGVLIAEAIDVLGEPALEAAWRGHGKSLTSIM
jgi:hypothetical protein